MAFETVDAKELGSRMRNNQDWTLIDVRSPGEFSSVHVQGATNIPMNSLTRDAVRSAQKSDASPIYVVCQGGVRSQKACQQLSEAGVSTINVDGGTNACIAAGLPVVRGKGTISLERQVRIAAGSLVLIGVILGFFVHPIAYGLSAFVGAGLVFAGVTDTCGMGMLLATMPWNQSKPSAA